MKAIGLVMNIKDFGVSDVMIESFADSILILEGGWI